ncbi:MAG: glycosyltransferase family 61 protein [Treponema sp.]|nr:glycosyltransferase family 61 protein [Treponema sp.]
MPSWSNEAYSFLLKGDSPSYMSGTSPADKLIYISRNRSGRRRILNEEELLPILKRYAFKTYYLEELGLLEQQQLFASARMVIAPHGAGLVNLVWSREGTTVLELYPQFYHDPSFRILSAAMRLDYHYLICTSPGSQEAAPVDEDILVDKLGLIESFLAERLHISERALSKATDC